ncbi:hypothetical protein VTO42DRAFT_5510 [Malbranchea cinnamomea]
MAFQTPLTLPATSVTTGLLSNALPVSWKSLKRPSTSTTSTVSQRPSVSQTAEREVSADVESIVLPDCLESVSIDALRSVNKPISFSTMLSRTLKSTRAGPSISLSRNGGHQLWSVSMVATARKPASARLYSTISLLQLNQRQGVSKVSGLPHFQHSRSFFGNSGGASQSLLAHRERTANNNPSSANAQNAFYSALLRANIPDVIVERYESGRFARNAFSDSLYHKALEQLGAEPQEQGQFQGTNNNLSSDQLQAVGHSIARAKGGQVGRIGMASKPGSKDSRLYVVMEESRTAWIFKLIKFSLYFGLTAYVGTMILNLFVETTGMLKNVRGPKANEAKPEHQKVRFSDVHGCDEAKEELQELVEFLSNPERFNALGGKLPKGVLLVGPPGTGKTLLARAVAGEAGVPFFYMSGSEFDEVYVGVGAKRVRELFNQARSKAPAIIFIDELDAIGARRNERDAAYVKQTLNQLLTELDGFSQSSGVIILAATNYPQLLDKALTRPGRFDRKIEVPLPDVRGRINILNHHMKNVPISTDVDVTVIARGTPGFSGADLENLVNQAAIRASRNKKSKVGPQDFDWAKDKIIMGAENRSRVLRDKDKLMTAYHEAGHALVAHFSPAATPLYKITIVPRGISLGSTHYLPEMDVYSKDYSQYLADIDVCMGGKAAEKLIYGSEKVSSGIAGDIQQATKTAFMMVTQLGYSPKLGNVDLRSNYAKLSSETKQEIEAEVRRIVNEASDRALNILKERRKELELLTRALLEYETLTKEEMEKVLRGEKLDKLDASPKAPIMLPDALISAPLNPKPSEAASRREAADPTTTTTTASTE